jgi:glucan phosphoethanolaminetransferase (alkaline phosphatase superfamily)
MLRVLLFALPFALYVGVLLAMKRDVKERAHWRYKQLLLLTITGVFFVFISIALFNNKAHLGDEYVPASFIDGVYKPAEWIKRK